MCHPSGERHESSLTPAGAHLSLIHHVQTMSILRGLSSLLISCNFQLYTELPSLQSTLRGICDLFSENESMINHDAESLSLLTNSQTPTVK
ncbi:hypothetical protein J6590_101568 [Homalodisca vitripennis]|nr:hypothetical protein J6590_101568 [Homalodisca vitripennis]